MDIFLFFCEQHGSLSAKWRNQRYTMLLICTIHSSDVCCCFLWSIKCSHPFVFFKTLGKRYSLPNSRIMIHQPLGGAQGGQTDIDIQVWVFLGKPRVCFLIFMFLPSMVHNPCDISNTFNCILHLDVYDTRQPSVSKHVSLLSCLACSFVLVQLLNHKVMIGREW